MATDLSSITDPEIKSMMKQYDRVVEMIKEDALKRWITFFGYWYFRKEDSIKNSDSSYIWTNTPMEPYDTYWAMRSVKGFLDSDPSSILH